jgi:hypothetical protein
MVGLRRIEAFTKAHVNNLHFSLKLSTLQHGTEGIRTKGRAAIIVREKKRWGWLAASRRWLFGKESGRLPKD